MTWRYWCCIATVAAGMTATAGPTNFLAWHPGIERMDADIKGETLVPLLRQISERTGWHVYMEPGTARTVSAKFKDLPSADALRMLFGGLNFSVSPRTNASPVLYVFSTRVQNATQLVHGEDPAARKVAGELLVKLRPGVNADDLAKMVGARIVARDDRLGLVRLQFGSEAAADAALNQLQNNSDVAAVDYNYYYDPPPPAEMIGSSTLSPVSLQLKPPGDTGKVIVGLIDTAVQRLDGSLNDFLMKSVSVAGDAGASGDLTHGTAMAETILRSVSVVEGGNSSVQILPVDVYGPNANTTSWDVALGIQAAVNNGATVVNLSLGGTGESSFLSALIQTAQNSGILFFAAAGNQPGSFATYPAAYPGVMAVTAEEQGKLAPYANYGSFVDLAAPDSTVAYLNNHAWFVQGTSVSTAYMTGLAAGTADATHQSWGQIQGTLLHSFPVPSK